MKIEKKRLIDDLLKRTEESSLSAQKFKKLNAGDLNYKKSPDEWSILECIEHLNLYGDFYLPEIERHRKTNFDAGRNLFHGF